ncbi:hypothetical protein Tco_1070091 [Tanacetum coccineum]|uniref:Secreted protein n=1 Tax=Tanacetum coccineum TaxID=301880 RepID=A0ABQ5HKP3_9ASTR
MVRYGKMYGDGGPAWVVIQLLQSVVSLAQPRSHLPLSSAQPRPTMRVQQGRPHQMLHVRRDSQTLK